MAGVGIDIRGKILFYATLYDEKHLTCEAKMSVKITIIRTSGYLSVEQ